MKYIIHKRSKRISKARRYGRIRPILFAVFILFAGLLLDKEWWKIGVVMLVAVFVAGYYRYRTPF